MQYVIIMQYRLSFHKSNLSYRHTGRILAIKKITQAAQDMIYESTS